jgi:type II secretory pathway component GspD/PulD (secretin)
MVRSSSIRIPAADRRTWSRWPLGIPTLLLAACCYRAAADEPDLLGMMALTSQADVAVALDLSPQQRTALDELVAQRQTAAAETLANVPAAQQAQAAAAFRAETERLGLELLNEKQRTTLQQAYLRRTGLASLAEPGWADTLGLTAAQRQKVAALLAERQNDLQGADERRQRIVRGVYEQQLNNVLDDQQRARWQQLLGNATVASGPQASASSSGGSQRPPAGAPGTTGSGASGDAAAGASAGQGTTPRRGAHLVSIDAPPRDGPAEKLRFNFRYQPWADVLDWFAQQADLSLVMEAPPPGTFNYTDSRDYTPEQAIDLLNSVLLTKGYTLVRRDRMLLLINLEDGIPPNLVSYVRPEDLDRRGEFELVSVLFPVRRLTPEEVEADIRKLIGPQGSVIALGKAGLVQVTETAGRLRMIRAYLQAVETPGGDTSSVLRVFELKHVLPSDVLGRLRDLLDIPAESNAAADGSIRLTYDPLTRKILATGQPEKIARAEEILRVLDVPLSGTDGPLVVSQPQLEVYPITVAQPQTVLAVLQTLLAGQPDVRLAIDPATGHLVAHARPEQHAVIRATIAQMQQDTRQVTVIPLRTLDPQVAVLAVSKLFGGTENNPAAPKVDADPLTRQLLVYGTPVQIAQIRDLLQRMGETESSASGPGGTGGNFRTLPLSGFEVQGALQRVLEIWPARRGNRVEVIPAPSAIPEWRPQQRPQPPGAPREGTAPDAALQRRKVQQADARLPGQGVVRAVYVRQPLSGHESEVGGSPLGRVPPAAVPTDAATGTAAAAAPPATEPAGGGPAAQQAAEPPARQAAPIYVIPGPGGVLLYSEDTEALDEFESLLSTLASPAFSGQERYWIFYLENANAVTVAETLSQIFGAGSAPAAGRSTGSLLGDVASAALGDLGGSILGSLLDSATGGGSSEGLMTGPVRIVPETRLNALIVQARPNDLDLIQQLVEKLDQAELPETQVAPRPRMIPLYNTSAAQVAEIIKQVYQENLVSASRSQQPSAEDFLRLLRGGRSGSGSSNRATENRPRLSIGVDTRTNSLIVSAPLPLFEEIRQLAETLDQQTTESNQVVRVVTLQRSNPQTIQKALAAIAGDKVRTQTTDTGSTASSAGATVPPSGQQPPRTDDQFQEALRQRIEFFNRLRGSGMFGTPGGSGTFGPPGGGFGDRSGGFGGGRSGGDGDRRGGR